MYRKLLFILCLFLVGCFGGNFDITKGLIRPTRKAPEKHVERISWVAYEDEEIGELSLAADRCALFYFKTAFECPECDAMDKSLKDRIATAWINEFFIAYKVTDDDPDWEKALVRLDVKRFPTIYIIKFDEPKFVMKREGFFNPRALNDMISESLGKGCYYD